MPRGLFVISIVSGRGLFWLSPHDPFNTVDIIFTWDSLFMREFLILRLFKSSPGYQTVMPSRRNLSPFFMGQDPFMESGWYNDSNNKEGGGNA